MEAFSWNLENNKESRTTCVKYSRPGGTPTGTDGVCAEGPEYGASPKKYKYIIELLTMLTTLIGGENSTLNGYVYPLKYPI